ncbi:hypothetical protein PSHT_01423 [Puccinia striiformis]|uniref:JmjC domain-containing protein n=1 Tax=Puccinia striiformis TaxID=27350 RepID=A0A2S4WKL7_9BASI|nr:hypothetical protein PSHT_01423 [Puccinia striiformis]
MEGKWELDLTRIETVQIVGRKYVWIAGPQFQTEMYPFGSTPPTIDRPEEEDQDHDDKETCLGSVEPDRLDEFRTRFPNFVEKVMPEALQIILEEGDMLVMPPGWWHSMKSLTPSINLSVWF